MFKRIKEILLFIGPGIAIAATGVGAGDMVAASVSGAKFGYAILWAVVVGSILKFVLNEGIARWQVATNTTLLEGWFTHLGPWVRYYFFIYLLLWTVIVGGALVNACALAGHTVFPQISLPVWGVLHSLMAILLLWVGRYEVFETLMKLFIGVMSVSLIGTAFYVTPASEVTLGLSQMSIPMGSSQFIMGVIGGVGGSLTILAYGYWIREKKWTGLSGYRMVQWDLGIAYFLTGVFGFSLMLLSAKILHPAGIEVKGAKGVLSMAMLLESELGRLGYWVFVIGYWGTVFSSLIGVWQCVPHIFCDFVELYRGEKLKKKYIKWYRGYLLYIGLVPLCLLVFNKPVFIILIYSVVGALFMPFLAATLWMLNSKHIPSPFKNGVLSNLILGLCFLLFGFLCVKGLTDAIGKFI